MENTVGRRTATTIAGNANPFQLDETLTPVGLYNGPGKQDDASATERITLSPPTGLDSKESRTTQLIIVILIATTIVGAGIVIIKKKVLPKK